VPNYLTLSGGGREVELGAFLTPVERIELKDRLEKGPARRLSGAQDLPANPTRKSRLFGVRGVESQPSRAFTIGPTAPKSICPVYLPFSTPMTRPMSRRPSAPVSAMASPTAAATSSSDSCRGR
jgi:hypothetical protein